MFDLTDPKTYWLNVTNIGLGLVVLVCIVAVARTFLLDLFERRGQRANEGAALDDHTFMEPVLGITMADGGENRNRKSE